MNSVPMFHDFSHIRNEQKYFDATVQEWHAKYFPEDYGAIDRDLGGYCKRCRSWLYIIEAAETRQKPTFLTERLSLQTGAVGLLIIHENRQVVCGQRVWPDFTPWLSEPHLRLYIHEIRKAHQVWHLQPKEMS